MFIFSCILTCVKVSKLCCLEAEYPAYLQAVFGFNAVLILGALSIALRNAKPFLDVHRLRLFGHVIYARAAYGAVC